MSSDAVEQIKNRLSIVDVVSSYVKLEKAGRNLKAKSPFSNEKTASFYVSPERGMYYCFSTNQGGDIFTFVQKMEGVDFRGALKILADRAGVKLTPFAKKDVDKRERLFSALEHATLHFQAALSETPEAQAYLKERGIQGKTVRAWRIGYAKPEWDSTFKHLTEKGFAHTELEACGLIKKSEKGTGYYDRFRGRLMFPICDPSGRVIGYSGRIFPHKSNPEFKEDAAKYINSPETPLYSKSHVLYGYDKAKNFIRKLRCSILVEGQMDVVLSHQAGYQNTVAVSGTALTLDQLGMLQRLSPNIVMAFDADRAGISSTGKGIELALSRGMDVKVAALPKGKDPADLARQSVDAWRATVRSAKPVIDFYLDFLESEHRSDTRKLRLSVSETVLPFVAKIRNKIDQAHFVSKIAQRLNIKEDPIWDEMKRMGGGAEKRSQPEKALHNVAVYRRGGIERRLLSILRWQQGKKKEERLLDVTQLEKRLTTLTGKAQFNVLQEMAQDEENKILFEAEMVYDGSHTLEEDVNELLTQLEKESLKEAYQQALESLRLAEMAGDTQAIKKKLEECNRLRSIIATHEAPTSGAT